MNTELKHEENPTTKWSTYSSSRINAHLMLPLFQENRKSIQKIFSGKKLYPRNLVNQ